MKNSYSTLISEAQLFSRPRILINICSHGNETIGLKVQELFAGKEIKNGSLTFHIGNSEALEQNKRFIESDLNRSFPGSLSGTKEEVIAANMMEYVPQFDYVFDIHSTVSDIKDCLIIEDDSVEMQKLIAATTHAKTALHMTATKGNSLFTACRTEEKIIPAVAFEYGDNSDEVAKKVYEDLSAMIDHITGVETENKKTTITQYECYKPFPKSDGDILSETIRNYELIKRGTVVGYTEDKEPIIAPEDFYPILFGETNYKTIFGFMGRNV